jgi:hypothetical protein
MAARGHNAKTPEGKAASLEALDRYGCPPGEAAITNGVTMRTGVFMPCSRCPIKSDCAGYIVGGTCGFEVAYVESRREAVQRIAHIEDIDNAPVEALVWTEIKLARAERYQALNGGYVADPKTGELRACHVADEVGRLTNQWMKWATHLGLSPVQRRLMAPTGQGLDVAVRFSRLEVTPADDDAPGSTTDEMESTDDEG